VILNSKISILKSYSLSHFSVNYVESYMKLIFKNNILIWLGVDGLVWLKLNEVDWLGVDGLKGLERPKWLDWLDKVWLDSYNASWIDSIEVLVENLKKFI